MKKRWGIKVMCAEVGSVLIHRRARRKMTRPVLERQAIQLTLGKVSRKASGIGTTLLAW